MNYTDIQKIESRLQAAFGRETKDSFNNWLTSVRDTRNMADSPIVLSHSMYDQQKAIDDLVEFAFGFCVEKSDFEKLEQIKNRL